MYARSGRTNVYSPGPRIGVGARAPRISGGFRLGLRLSMPLLRVGVSGLRAQVTVGARVFQYGGGYEQLLTVAVFRCVDYILLLSSYLPARPSRTRPLNRDAGSSHSSYQIKQTTTTASRLPPSRLNPPTQYQYDRSLYTEDSRTTPFIHSNVRTDRRRKQFFWSLLEGAV